MNFAIILFGLLVFTFAAWLLERFVLKPGRERRANAAVSEFDATMADALSRSHGCVSLGGWNTPQGCSR